MKRLIALVAFTFCTIGASFGFASPASAGASPCANGQDISYVNRDWETGKYTFVGRRYVRFTVTITKSSERVSWVVQNGSKQTNGSYIVATYGMGASPEFGANKRHVTQSRADGWHINQVIVCTSRVAVH